MLTGGPRGGTTTALLLGAIVAGGLLGALAPDLGTVLAGGVDPSILLLVGALFFTLRLDGIRSLRRSPRTMLLALGMNFLLIPPIAIALTLLLPGEALRLGVLIYCLAPCTDWFLGFTRLAGGDTTTGAALIPVQLTLQLALYPLWLALFAGRHVEATAAQAVPALLTWFALPAVVGLATRLVVHAAIPRRRRDRTVDAVGRGIPLIVAALIVCLFAGNVRAILADPASFAGVLVVVFLFFAVAYVLGEAMSRLARLRPAEHVLLTMTTSARNAPLMLAVTTVALPGQPVVYAGIVLGMLIEFPHLTALAHLLRRRRPRARHPGRAASPVT